MDKPPQTPQVEGLPEASNHIAITFYNEFSKTLSARWRRVGGGNEKDKNNIS